MDNILKMEKIVPGSPCPVMVSKIPKSIMSEIKQWVMEKHTIGVLSVFF